MDMLKIILQANTRIYVALSTDRANDYESRIEDVQREYIVITLPYKHEQAMPLNINTDIHISALTEKGRFGFDSRVLEVSDNIVTISAPDSCSKEPLRQAFRVPVTMQVQVRVGDNVVQLAACLDDISAGGCRMALEGMSGAELANGTPLNIDFAGTALDLAIVQAKTIRLIDQQGSKQIFSIEFIDMSERDRDLIALYIFQRQLELRELLG